ncbi:MAG: hypothetical protein INR65_00840 [Gluconacetobacter diazotrophicus]|nr:hypothetical protein [Gluconacetobacter diazotrophicus]
MTATFRDDPSDRLGWELREIRSGPGGRLPDDIVRRMPIAPMADRVAAREAAIDRLNAVAGRGRDVDGIVIVDEADATVARVLVWDILYSND